MTDKTAIRQELAECMQGDRQYAETFFIGGISHWDSDTIRDYAEAESLLPKEGREGVTEAEMIDALAAKYADSASKDPEDAQRLVNLVTENWLDDAWENYAGLAPAGAGTTM